MIKPKPKFCVVCGGKLYRSTAKVCSVNCSLQYNIENPETVKSFIKEQQEKKLKQEKRELESWRKQEKQKQKSLTDLENEAKVVFQKWVRLRDQDLPCISSGVTFSPIWDGGHFYEANQYSGLIFEPMNCHKQSRADNYFKHSNNEGYRRGLLERYGKEYLDKLDKMAVEKRNYKYTREELIAIKKKYQLKIKNHEY